MQLSSGYLFGLASGLFWAINGILYEILNNQYSFIQSLSIILFLFFAELCALFFVFFFNRNKIHSCNITHSTIFISILSGIIGAPIGMICYLKAIQYIGIGYTAPISSIYPIIGSIFAFLFLKDKLSRLGMCGFAISIFCTIILSLDLTQSKSSLFGFILAFLCAFSWGTEVFLSSLAMRKINSTTTYFFRQMGAVLGYLLIIPFISLDLMDYSEIKIDLSIILIIVSAITSSSLSYFLYYKAIYIIKPIRAMSLNMTYLFWVLIITSLINKQYIDIYDWLLSIGLVVGITLTNYKKE